MLVMEMSNKKQQIPTIRFKGFTDTWEQRKLKELTEVITKGTTPKDKSGKGSINFVKVENINKSSGEIDIKSKITENEHEGYLKRSQLKDGDILFSIAGTLGRTAIVKKELLPANTNQALAIIRLDEGDKNYITTFLNGRAAEDFIKKNPTVGAQPNLSLEQVGNLLIEIPSLEEQTKIGSFFKQLDDTIALHQRQLNNYKQQKKYMLQKMFPKDGEKVPEVRFDGFTEEWEQCNLGDVAMIKTGYPFNSEDFDGSGKYLVITNGNIQNDLAFVDNSLGNRIDVSDTVLLNNYELNIGDVLVTMDGTVGRTAKVICSNQIIAQRVGRLIAKDNSEFLYQSLNTGDFSKEMKKVSHGGTIKHISLTEISDYAMFVPATVEEQTKIGAFFKHLDDATDHHQQKVNGYQQLKNAMLQQMFV